MTQTIAIVEDEPELRANYSDALERYGYRVRGYADRPRAQEAFQARLPDMAIIDIGLGDEPEGGFELCRFLRGQSTSLPILFLTARDSDLDAISGLRLGADDYLTKDISTAHLLARVVALFRRAGASDSEIPQDSQVTRGALEIRPEQMTVSWHGRSVPLTVTEFWIVHVLARYPGHVKSRRQLMEAASLVVDETTITSHVKRIRRKFQNLDPDFDELATVHGAGYRWKA